MIIYGSYGFSGDLIVRRAMQVGLDVEIAGRSESKLRVQARAMGVPYRCFSVTDPAAVRDALSEHDCLLNCAGPFSETALSLVDGCLETHTHYLDITGEVDVFEALSPRHEAAREAGIMILPGVGFDVVPTDCLANHLKSRLPGASMLRLAFTVSGRLSRGTLKTMLRNLNQARLVRSDGVLVQPISPEKRFVDFGQGPKRVVPTVWGDLSTAFWSTGIENIEVFAASSTTWRLVQRLAPALARLASVSSLQPLIEGVINLGPRGPSSRTLKTRRTRVWGEVCDSEGSSAAGLLSGPDGYVMTSLCATTIASRVLNGDFRPGFQTPSTVYGPDFILEIDGVKRNDI